MFRIVYACIAGQHDPRLVALAVLVGLFACVATVNLYRHAAKSAGWPRIAWLAAVATVFGSGAFTLHIVAQIAYQPGIPIGYDPMLMLVALAVAVLGAGLGFAVALPLRAPLIGGCIIGGAVAAMHYLGMAALRAPVHLDWNYGFVAASVVIALAGCAAAMRLLAAGAALRYRVAAALLFVVTICAMHFTGMAAVTLVLDPSITISGAFLVPQLLALAIVAVAVRIVALGLIGPLIDDHWKRRATAEADGLTRRVEERTRELRQAQDQLLRQERLSAVGQVTATMAHELRNPLSAIRNTTYTLQEAIGANPELERLLTRIERAVARCDRTVSDLLDYTQKRRLACERAAPDRWLGAAIAELAVPKNIMVQQDLHSGGIELRFDGDRMRRVIASLAENAVQAINEADGPERRIIFSTRRVEGWFELVVADTGIGIPTHILPSIFEPLFSTKSFGAGLGLPMVRQIVEQHGGTVEIISELGCGTRAVVRLPLPAAQELAA